MKLTKEQIEDNLKSYKNGYWGSGVGIKELFETALELYAELDDAKLDIELCRCVNSELLTELRRLAGGVE